MPFLFLFLLLTACSGPNHVVTGDGRADSCQFTARLNWERQERINAAYGHRAFNEILSVQFLSPTDEPGGHAVNVFEYQGFLWSADPELSSLPGFPLKVGKVGDSLRSIARNCVPCGYIVTSVSIKPHNLPPMIPGRPLSEIIEALK